MPCDPSRQHYKSLAARGLAGLHGFQRCSAGGLRNERPLDNGTITHEGVAAWQPWFEESFGCVGHSDALAAKLLSSYVLFGLPAQGVPNQLMA